jgi:methionyl-tRNA formyltransferase
MKVGILSNRNSVVLGRYLRALTTAGVGIACIVLDDKADSARDLEIWNERTLGRLPEIPLGDFADLSIPTYYVADHRSPECTDLIRAQSIDVLANAGTPRILRGPILDVAPLGVLNLHPGLLPHYRGCTSVEWSIYNDDPVGNTVHVMNASIDEGPIVATEPVGIEAGTSYSDVRLAVYRHGFDLMARVVRQLVDGVIDRSVFRQQTDGTYRKPIGTEEMSQVMAKLAAGRYRSVGAQSSN